MGESDSWNRLTSSSVLSSQDAEGELEIGDARVEWNGMEGLEGRMTGWMTAGGNNKATTDDGWMALGGPWDLPSAGPGICGSAIGGDGRRHDNI